MELEIIAGGITYDVEVDIDEGYVCSVFSVEVYDGKKFHKIDMDSDKLNDFYNRYEDDLQQAYEDHKIAMAESAGEERWERQNDR